ITCVLHTGNPRFVLPCSFFKPMDSHTLRPRSRLPLTERLTVGRTTSTERHAEQINWSTSSQVERKVADQAQPAEREGPYPQPGGSFFAEDRRPQVPPGR